jgi:hypothetical protein
MQQGRRQKHGPWEITRTTTTTIDTRTTAGHPQWQGYQQERGRKQHQGCQKLQGRKKSNVASKIREASNNTYEYRSREASNNRVGSSLCVVQYYKTK